MELSLFVCVASLTVVLAAREYRRYKARRQGAL